MDLPPPPPPPPPAPAPASSAGHGKDAEQDDAVSSGVPLPPPPPSAAADSSSSAPPPPPPPPPSSTPPPPPPPTTPSKVSAANASAPTSPGHGAPVPASKLVSHLPLDAPDDLDRKWYAHFYHMQKALQGLDEAAALNLLKPPQAGAAPPSLPFQPDIALLYAIITEPLLAKQYLRYLTAVAAMDNYKNVTGWLQKLIDQKFVKLLGSCRSQLLWLVRELVHSSVPAIDRVLIALLRHLPGGDASRTSVWLASSIVRILVEHEAWLLSCSHLIPYVFHTFARIVVDHTSHQSLMQQEIELCTLLWNRRQADVAALGREVVRVLNDAKDIPGMNALWKQLRSVRDDADSDLSVYSVARLMGIPTPPKYLAYRLTPKMEECLVFMMERVQLGYVTRYQKWFASQFLSSPGSDALVPDLVRYVCAVFHPSNQILSSKITPRYHILGWLYLLCKSPTVLARVQLAMFFDYLYFKPSDNIMNVEPAMLLMVKSLKSHPQMTLAMIQFLVFAVEKFASSPTNKQHMHKGVSTAFTMLLKLGVVQSIHTIEVPPSLLVLGHEDFKSFQEMMPEPCTRPTEGFLESLNDILISWIRQDNAQELAPGLGSFLYASLERMVVSSKISMSDVPKATCASVFDSMLDQVLSEQQELFVPFLQAMHGKDISIGFRLLAFCCSRHDGKSVEATLSPYVAFVEAIGGNLAQSVLKDLSLSQHIDDARAHATALLGKGENTQAPVKDEVGAVDAAVLYILPYLFRNLDHPSLGHLQSRGDALIQLFISLLTPATFQTIAARIMLHEFSVVKSRLASILVSSLSWSSWEQYVIWDIVIVEIQSTNLPSAVKNVMAAARKVLACIQPDEHVESMNGLLKCLVQFSPDASMLQTTFKLSGAFDDFALAVLSNWIDRCPEVVKNYMLVILQTGNESTKDVNEILQKLEQLQSRRGSHTLTILKDDVILSALRKIVQSHAFPTISSFLVTSPLAAPASSPASLASSSSSSPSSGLDPPLKKQRLLGDN
ncbi:hypothetical protein ATCC90586_002386 [Pythium insidiosum]|nr:hypothetical protein ATCC90586_002386 [Pythium insidiosum]